MSKTTFGPTFTTKYFWQTKIYMQIKIQELTSASSSILHQVYWEIAS